MSTAMQEQMQKVLQARNGLTEGGKTALHEGAQSARARIAALLDAGSFVESELLHSGAPALAMPETEVPGDGVVCGWGTVEDRPVCVFAQDATVLGGSMGAIHAGKIERLIDRAMTIGCPLVGLWDSGGARLQEGVAGMAASARVMQKLAQASGVIPTIALVMGNCAGGAAMAPALMDFTLLAQDNGHVFVTAPLVLEAVSGQKVTAESLGGAAAAEANGLCHYFCKGETDLIAQARLLLSLLPDNNAETAPMTLQDADWSELREDLDNIWDENGAYDIREVLAAFADDGEYFETQSAFGSALVTALARVGGRSVGFVASDAAYNEGRLDINACAKAARFVRFCDAYNIPVLTLADTAGFVIDIEQESNGLARAAAQLLYAYSEASTVKITVVLGKALGGAYAAMACKPSADAVYAWPVAEIAPMAAETAAAIMYRNEAKEAADPVAFRAEKAQQYRDTVAGPLWSARCGQIDDVIRPAASRAVVIGALEMMMGKRESRPPRKHGNMPL